MPSLVFWLIQNTKRMAEFCNKCAKEWGMKADIDIYKIHSGLDKGYQRSVLCEGCEIIAVSKEDDGALMVGYPDRETGLIKWTDYPLKRDMENEKKTGILQKVKTFLFKGE